MEAVLEHVGLQAARDVWYSSPPTSWRASVDMMRYEGPARPKPVYACPLDVGVQQQDSKPALHLV